MDFQEHYEEQIRLRDSDTQLHNKIMEYKDHLISELARFYRYQSDPRNEKVNRKDILILQTIFKAGDPTTNSQIRKEIYVKENEVTYCYDKTRPMGYVNKINGMRFESGPRLKYFLELVRCGHVDI